MSYTVFKTKNGNKIEVLTTTNRKEAEYVQTCLLSLGNLVTIKEKTI